MMSPSQRTPDQWLPGQRLPGQSSTKRQKRLWKRWWVWCILSLGLVGVALSDRHRFETFKVWLSDGRARLTAEFASLSSLLKEPRRGKGHVESQREENLASVEPTLAEGRTTGDSQIDAY